MKLNDELSRRFFLSTAVAGGVGLVGIREVQGSTVYDEFDELLRPTPADALVDVLELTENIEGNILKKYYRIIGNISNVLNNRYKDLKEDVLKFRKLVPEFREGSDLSRMENGSRIGNLTAMSLVGIAGIRDFSVVENQSAVMLKTSADMKKVSAKLNSRANSITLSDEAVLLLRKIFEQIENLYKPTEGLRQVSSLLFSTSSGLRKVTGKIRALIVESVRLLVAADLIQTRPATASTNHVLGELRSDRQPTSIDGLRTKAVSNLVKIEKLMAGLEDYPIPEELKEFQTTGNDDVDDDAVPVSALLALLKGAKTWIGEGIQNDQSVIENRRGEGKFLKVAFKNQERPFWAFDIALWNGIVKLVANDIPEANYDRVVCLYKQKKLLDYSFTRVSRQEEFFYNLVLTLDPLSRFDLRAQTNKTKRRAAAEGLARL